jgi:hypothetical protein
VTAFSRRKKFGLRHNSADKISKLLLPIPVVGVATRTMNDHIARHRWDVPILINLWSRGFNSVLESSYCLAKHTTITGDATVGIPPMLALMFRYGPLRDLSFIITRHSLAFFITSFITSLANKIDFIQTDISPIPLSI